MNRKQRMQNRTNAAVLNWRASVCPKCGKTGKHYAPASLGEQGFYACSAFKEAK